jgi:hypothetical protein
MFYTVVAIYRGYEICKMNAGYTVEYLGDEIYFNTVDDAKLFIDEIK